MSDTPRTDAIIHRLRGESGLFCDDKSLEQYNDLVDLALTMERELAGGARVEHRHDDVLNDIRCTAEAAMRIAGLAPAGVLYKLEAIVSMASAAKSRGACIVCGLPREECIAKYNADHALNGLSPKERLAANTGPLTVAALMYADDAPKMARPFHTRHNAERLLSFREAHCQGDHDEAWHQIYSMVAENCADPYNPWTELEKLSPTPDVPPEEHHP